MDGTDRWEVALGLAVVVALWLAVVALARASVRRGERYQTRSRRFVCPRLDKPVACVVVEDIRTGRWKAVRMCSAFATVRPPLCAQECVTLENRGFHLRPAELH